MNVNWNKKKLSYKYSKNVVEPRGVSNYYGQFFKFINKYSKKKEEKVNTSYKSSEMVSSNAKEPQKTNDTKGQKERNTLELDVRLM